MRRPLAVLLAVLVASGLILYLVSDILLPFLVGAGLAYLLDPLADRFQRIGISRLWATVLILFIFVLVVVLSLVILVPLAVQQITSFAEQVPSYVSRLQTLIADHGAPLIEKVGGRDALAQVQRSIGDIVGQGTAWIVTFVKSLWSGGKAVVGVVSILVVTPVVAFYLLVDWDRMIDAIDGWVPPRHQPVVRQLAHEMDRALSGFLRGQFAVCLFLGCFYAAGLILVGLNFGGLIGMVAGMISFIPYVGSLTGLFVAVTVALVQFLPDWTWVLVTLGVFLVGQFIEGNILAPKLVGEAVGLHPVWLMFALLAFGSLFGFTGLLLAVPISAMLGVLARYGLRRYLGSELYLGPPSLRPLPEVRSLSFARDTDVDA